MSRTALYGLKLHTDTVPALIAVATRHLPPVKTHRDSVRSLICGAVFDYERGADESAVEAVLTAVYLSVGNSHPDYGHACQLVQIERRAA